MLGSVVRNHPAQPVWREDDALGNENNGFKYCSSGMPRRFESDRSLLRRESAVSPRRIDRADIKNRKDLGKLDRMENKEKEKHDSNCMIYVCSCKPKEEPPEAEDPRKIWHQDETFF